MARDALYTRTDKGITGTATRAKVFFAYTAAPSGGPPRPVAQSSDTAVVRSTDTVTVVQRKLDNRYVTRKRCTRRLAVDKPGDYLRRNRATAHPEDGRDRLHLRRARPDRAPSGSFAEQGLPIPGLGRR